MSWWQQFAQGFLWMVGWVMLFEGIKLRFGKPTMLMVLGAVLVIFTTLAMNNVVVFR